MCISFDADWGYWVLSTIVQSASALLAILGAVAIYTHQAVNRIRYRAFDYWKQENLDKLVEGYLSDNYSLIKEQYREYQALEDKNSIGDVGKKYLLSIKTFLFPNSLIFLYSLSIPTILTGISLAISMYFLFKYNILSDYVIYSSAKISSIIFIIGVL